MSGLRNTIGRRRKKTLRKSAQKKVAHVARRKTAMIVRDDSDGTSELIPYDESLFECARTQWQFGDWASLARLEHDTLQHHPHRAKLALLVAAGHIQNGAIDKGRQFVRLARSWGCAANLVNQVLISGVYNTLGRAAALLGREQNALEHFSRAISSGTPGAEARLLTRARANQQLSQLGLTPFATPHAGRRGGSAAVSPELSVIDTGLERLGETLKQHKIDLDTQLKKNAEDLVRVRKYIETAFKREITNATRQIEAFIGVHNYFATGELPKLSTEAHAWPISPDFALYLIELLETRDYDLVVEFGSGFSTIVIAKTLAVIAARSAGERKISFVSFDHLDPYYTQTRLGLQQSGVADLVQLVLAPLESYQAPNGESYPYYACEDVLANMAKQHPSASLRILVVVDGPPAATCKHARYPAAPIMLAHFPNAEIDLLLDDYVRDEEKEIASLWQKELAAMNRGYVVSERKLEKDACLLTIFNSSEGVTE